MKRIIDYTRIGYFTFLFAFFPLVISRVAELWFRLWHKNGKEKHQQWYHRKQASWCKNFLCKWIPGVSVSIENESGETFEKPAIIIANHQSMLDIPAIFMLHPRIVGMAKEALFQNRIFSTMAKHKELVSNATPVRNILMYARKKLSDGFSFLIFPEGTRSRDFSIQPLKDGAFFFAEALKCDIVPVTIWGSGKVMPVSGNTCPGPIVVEIGQRQPYDGKNRKQMAEYWHEYFTERFRKIGSRAD